MVAAPSKSLFHSVAVGFMIGAGLFLFLGFLLFVLASPMAQHMGLGSVLGVALFLPVALVLNGYLTAGLVMLGLWVFAKLRGSRASAVQ